MNHSYFEDRLSAYFDSDLDPYEDQVVQEHLENCHSCRQKLEEFQKLEQMVDKESQFNNNSYWEKSSQKIEASLDKKNKADVMDIKRKKHDALFWKIAGVAATVIFLTYVAFYEDSVNKQSREILEPPAKKTEIVLQKEKQTNHQSVEEKIESKITAGDRSIREEVVKNETPDATSKKAVLKTPDKSSIKKSVPKQASKAPKIQMKTEENETQKKEKILNTAKRKSVHTESARESYTSKLQPAVDIIDMSVFISERDSLLDIFNNARLEISKKSKIKSANLKNHISNKDSLNQNVELQLLDVQYKIANNSKSSKDRQSGISFFKEYLNIENISYKEKAQKYLELLLNKNDN